MNQQIRLGCGRNEGFRSGGIACQQNLGLGVLGHSGGGRGSRRSLHLPKCKRAGEEQDEGEALFGAHWHQSVWPYCPVGQCSLVTCITQVTRKVGKGGLSGQDGRQWTAWTDRAHGASRF